MAGKTYLSTFGSRNETTMRSDKRFPNQGYRLGVLGGGQLGKMMGIAAADWHLPISFLDTAADFPAGPVSHQFVEGSFKAYDDVLQFGRTQDVVTIEIEHVNLDALRQLKADGIPVHPRPEALALINDKGLQNRFYRDHGFPTPAFQEYDHEEALRKAVQDGRQALPFVQKTRTAGYDGKGVFVVQSMYQLDHLLSGPCVAEELIDIDKELAVIVARNPAGQTAVYPMVEMEFNPEANLVEFLLCPSRVAEELKQEATQLAVRLIESLDICGLLAVELFLTRDGRILVNEVAPRPHNSGHHTIDSCVTSQFQQHLRGVLDLPLGDPSLHTPAVMVNVLGEPGHTGPVRYEGMEKVLAIPGAYVHLYGKLETRPFRKMGHVTVIDPDLDEAIAKAKKVKATLKVMSS